MTQRGGQDTIEDSGEIAKKVRLLLSSKHQKRRRRSKVNVNVKSKLV